MANAKEVSQMFGSLVTNYPEEFEEICDENVAGNVYVMGIRHKETGVTRYYPYEYDNGQTKWGKWFHGGNSVKAVAYVSRPYSSKSSAKRAIA